MTSLPEPTSSLVERLWTGDETKPQMPKMEKITQMPVLLDPNAWPPGTFDRFDEEGRKI